MLLTMKSRPILPLPGVVTFADLYSRRHWRRAQYLADQLWFRWRREVSSTLTEKNEMERTPTKPKRTRCRHHEGPNTTK